MKCWKIKILPVLLLPLLLSEPAHGGQNEIENQDVPVIVMWQEGHGFGAVSYTHLQYHHEHLRSLDKGSKTLLGPSAG